MLRLNKVGVVDVPFSAVHSFERKVYKKNMM